MEDGFWFFDEGCSGEPCGYLRMVLLNGLSFMGDLVRVYVD